MKIKTIVYGVVFILVFWISIPLALLFLNNYLNLPVLDIFYLKLLGILLLVLDPLIFFYCSNLFMKHGKGTPIHIDSPKKFVAKGIYKYSRNPIYIGHIFGFLGIALIFGQLLLFVYVPLIFLTIHLIVIFIEEPHLKRKFGKSYDEYRKKVHRWL